MSAALEGLTLLFIAYFLAYNTYTLLLMVLSVRAVRRHVVARFTGDLDLIDDAAGTPPVTVIVPAYNEEVTVVDNVTNLLQLDYPRFEVVVVNDGSRDATLERLRGAFRLRRSDVPYRAAIATAPVRARYQASIPLPPQVLRLSVLDKENGGKADALNVGINASLAPYVVTLDADSILEPTALKEMMRAVQEDQRIGAIGGQVAIANGCTLAGGRVAAVGLPSHPLARFQMVEYLRSFTTGRTALDELGGVLILSGAFAVFDKELLIRAGGYLTEFLEHRLTAEYVGGRRATVCEDMEVIVRLHRYIRDKGLDRRVAYLPVAVAWTECPESATSLRKQRGRWFRGLRESLFYHRGMLFRRRYGRIGWFALPTYWAFEYWGTVVELTGYVLLAAQFAWAAVVGTPLVDLATLAGFSFAALGYGILVNVVAVLVGAWRFRVGLADLGHRGLLPFARRGEVLRLLGFAVLENLGYRQLTLWWRLRGLWDAWRGKTGWEKFARLGFRTHEAPRGA